jgi:hypothetical protein
MSWKFTAAQMALSTSWSNLYPRLISSRALISTNAIRILSFSGSQYRCLHDNCRRKYSLLSSSTINVRVFEQRSKIGIEKGQKQDKLADDCVIISRPL